MSREADEILVDLARHPGWKILEERVLDYQRQESEILARQLVRGQEPLDNLTLARARGFWAGQRWLLRQVRHELTAYQKAEEKAVPIHQ